MVEAARPRITKSANCSVTRRRAGATTWPAKGRTAGPRVAATGWVGIVPGRSLCSPSMLSFTGGTGVEFLPTDDARAWLAEGLGDLVPRLGQPAVAPRIVTETNYAAPRDLDRLFEIICGVQAQVGQADVEFALVEIQPGQPPVPKGFAPLGNPEGQLLHTFSDGDEFAMVVAPSILRSPALTFASVARELGRIAVARAGGHRVDEKDVEADAEIAAVALGLGVWVANGAYIYENACCGGGCGIDLRSIRAGLSMPEAVFVLALDLSRRGLSPRIAAKHLESTQKAAFKKAIACVDRAPSLRALMAAPAGTLPG